MWREFEVARNVVVHEDQHQRVVESGNEHNAFVLADVGMLRIRSERHGRTVATIARVVDLEVWDRGSPRTALHLADIRPNSTYARVLDHRHEDMTLPLAQLPNHDLTLRCTDDYPGFRGVRRERHGGR